MDDLLRNRWALLSSNGYFPEELPPLFTPKDLMSIIQNPTFEITQYSNRGRPKASKILPYSIPKVKGYRRMLGIPGPFHYIQLAHLLVNNSVEIAEFLTKSAISIFKDFDPNNKGDRYIPKPDFAELVEQRILRSTGYRYMLSVDITRFYSSIYTHSIPWALYEKTYAKENRRVNNLGNLIDTYCRQCQDDQTMGLPIGPDTSRIISEIVLTAIDQKLKSELEDLNGIRNVDDYSLYFRSVSELEKARTLLHGSLREFELELNVAKEKVAELPEIMESSWKAAIQAFRFRESRKFQRTDLIAFFDLCFSLARKFPQEVILPYGIGKLSGLDVSRENYELFEAFLLNALVLESKVVRQIVQELLYYKKKKEYPINRDRIQSALESFLLYHAEHDHHFEITWVLWYMYDTEMVLSDEVTSVLNKSTNDFVILMLFLLEKEGLLNARLDKEIWKPFMTKDHLRSEHWLLSYESIAGGYLSDSSNYAMEDSFFAMLYESKVRFIKPGNEFGEHNRIDVTETSLAKEEVMRERAVSTEDLNGIDFLEDDLPF